MAAVLKKKTANTGSRCNIPCDANMEPCEFSYGDWCHDAKTQMKTLVNGVSTCRTEVRADVGQQVA